jgi:hypothetical protein
MPTTDLVNPFIAERNEDLQDAPDPLPGHVSPVININPSEPFVASPPGVAVHDFGQVPPEPRPAAAMPRNEEDQDLAERMRNMEIEMFHLRRERDNARNTARYFNDEATRMREHREGTAGTNSTFTNDHPRSKIKPSDLPKFYGKDTEDVDEWIEKVSAIFTYSRARDIDLLRILPLLLQGNASEWFTTLGEEGRARLTSWDSWKAALRNGFYLPDHEMTKQMLCRNRMLKKTESFGDYFQSRRALQRYVYPHGTSDKVLIRDIMEGIPQHLHPIIRANSIGVRNIEDFRRVLIDLEPGIRDFRAYTPHVPRSANTHKGAVNNIQAPSNKGSDKKTHSPPKTPCRCGEMHWYADCPLKKKTASVNFASKKEPATFPNNVPLGKNTKWRPQENKNEERFKEVNVATRSRNKNDKPMTKPSDALPAQMPLSLSPDSDKGSQADICPTFAMAKVGSEDGMLHKVCIDTGSSISCIDYDYAKRHLPDLEVKPTSNFRLLGVGTNMTTGRTLHSTRLASSIR